MRELKFRAWVGGENTDRDGEEMHYEYGLCLLNGKYADANGYGDVYGTYEEVHIEQYTGLKDKNGKEIYEGDIVKLLDAPAIKGKALIVKFGEFLIGEYNCNKMTGWMIQVVNGEWVSSLADENANCEVIGNIHENKELLK